MISWKQWLVAPQAAYSCVTFAGMVWFSLVYFILV